jgi:hypothetical protein
LGDLSLLGTINHTVLIFLIQKNSSGSIHPQDVQYASMEVLGIDAEMDPTDTPIIGDFQYNSGRGARRIVQDP